jgi:hypothetical protein
MNFKQKIKKLERQSRNSNSDMGKTDFLINGKRFEDCSQEELCPDINRRLNEAEGVNKEYMDKFGVLSLSDRISFLNRGLTIGDWDI